MCGRFALASDDREMMSRFHLSATVQARATYNAVPGMFSPIILRKSPNKAILARWGLVPHWAKDHRIGYKMINARAEGIENKPSFRRAFRSQRCLVPTTGFYEWKSVEGEKVPFFIHLKDQSLFAFAGLWEEWKDAEGRPLITFTIITTTPNDLVSPIHDRMPVILSNEDVETWLDPNVTEPERLLPLLDPYPQKTMEAYPVSTLVNSPRNDSPDLIAR